MDIASTHSSTTDVHRASDHGFDYHLVTPVDPDRLARLLDGAEGT